MKRHILEALGTGLIGLGLIFLYLLLIWAFICGGRWLWQIVEINYKETQQVDFSTLQARYDACNSNFNAYKNEIESREVLKVKEETTVRK